MGSIMVWASWRLSLRKGTMVTRASNDRDSTTLDDLLVEIERRFGPWALYRVSQARPRPSSQSIPTGSLTLDLATGIGGIPRGRITELAGARSSGKRTLAAHVVANAQRTGGFVAYIDASHAFDAERLARCGADLADLLLAVPDDLIEACTMVELLVRSRGLDAVILDGLPGPDGVTPSAGSAPLPVLLGRALRRLTVGLRGSPAAVLVVQDLRDRLRHDDAGSRVLRYAASLRVLIEAAAPLRHPSGAVVGFRAQVSIRKNKLAPVVALPIPLELDEWIGIRHSAEVIDLGLAFEVIERHDLGLIAAGQVLGRSRASAIARLNDEPDLRQELEGRIRADWLSRPPHGCWAQRSGDLERFQPPN